MPHSNDPGTSNQSAGPVAFLERIARDQAPVLVNLFELYVHDFSEYVPLQVKPSGRFEVTPSELWWSRDDHYPFLVRSQGELSGFALVRKGSRVTGSSPTSFEAALSRAQIGSVVG